MSSRKLWLERHRTAYIKQEVVQKERNKIALLCLARSARCQTGFKAYELFLTAVDATVYGIIALYDAVHYFNRLLAGENKR